MNSVILRDANLLSTIDKFSEEFAGCQYALLIDFFSRYNQLTLDEKSRDMTAFDSPLGLLQMIMLLIRATNLVA